MNIGKKILITTLLSSTIGSILIANDDIEYGIGYTGMYYGNYLQGISARGWMSNIGLEANFGSINLSEDEEDAYLYSAKIMYAPIIKNNSKFYIGVEGGLIDIDSTNENVNLIRPFFGSEYSMEETPEISFCWEAGYLNSSSDGTNVLSGTSISIGIHYYF